MKLLRFLYSKVFFKNLFLAGVSTGLILIIVFSWLKVYTLHGKSFAVPNLLGMTISEAQTVAEDKNIRLEIVDSVYLKTHKRGSIVDQNPDPEIKVKKNRRVFLTVNALHLEKTTMPNLVGISLRQAQALLENRGLIIGELTYVPDIADNNVLKQKYEGEIIRPGDTLFKDSKIDLVLGRGLSNRTTVTPRLIGLRLEDARKRIAASSLNMGNPIYDESVLSFKDSINAVIWKQVPEPSSYSRIRLGSTVDIFLTVDEEKLLK